MQTIYLIACCKTKGAAAMPARDLYQSDLFVTSVQFAEAAGSAWYVLSAAHGLVHPDTVIEPYDKTLADLLPSERRAWARRVIAQLDATVPHGVLTIFLAGRLYREGLLEWASRRFFVPMAGLARLFRLALGEQKRWLIRKLADAAQVGQGVGGGAS